MGEQMAGQELRLAAIGCSGKITEIFVDGFLGQGVKLRLLARDAERVARRHPAAEVVKGSMLNPRDVVPVLEGVDAAFVTTPMGLRNDKTLEVEAGRAVIEAARIAKLKHLIYVSVLGVDAPNGLSLFDAKYEVEGLLKQSGVPWTAIRCGTYMEDVFDHNLAKLKQGQFLFPVIKDRRFHYTCQADLPRFVVQELLQKNRVLNRAFNFITPGSFSIFEVEKLLTQALGKPVKASGKFPLYYMLRLMQPYFYLRNHRFSTIIPLLGWFNKYGYPAPGQSVQDLFPQFHMTTLAEHFQKILK